MRKNNDKPYTGISLSLRRIEAQSKRLSSWNESRKNKRDSLITKRRNTQSTLSEVTQPTHESDSTESAKPANIHLLIDDSNVRMQNESSIKIMDESYLARIVEASHDNITTRIVFGALPTPKLEKQFYSKWGAANYKVDASIGITDVKKRAEIMSTKIITALRKLEESDLNNNTIILVTGNNNTSGTITYTSILHSILDKYNCHVEVWSFATAFSKSYQALHNEFPDRVKICYLDQFRDGLFNSKSSPDVGAAMTISKPAKPVKHIKPVVSPYVGGGASVAATAIFAAATATMATAAATAAATATMATATATMATAATVTMATPDDNLIHILFDDSNVRYSPLMQEKRKELGTNVHLNTAALKEIVENGRNIQTRSVVGSASTARGSQKLRNAWENVGYTIAIQQRSPDKGEQFVDQRIQSSITRILYEHTNANYNQTIVLVSGDGNKQPGVISFPDLLRMSLRQNFMVEVWAFKESMSREYYTLKKEFPTQVKLSFLNKHFDRIYYV